MCAERETQALYKLDSCPVWLRQRCTKVNRGKKQHKVLREKTLSPLGDLGTVDEQKLENETGALSNAEQTNTTKLLPSCSEEGSVNFCHATPRAP